MQQNNNNEQLTHTEQNRMITRTRNNEHKRNNIR
jgi:hypothetical protein